MHNLRPSNKDAFDIFREAVNRKQKGYEKTLLTTNEAVLKNCYDQYNDCFATNNLLSISPHVLTSELKAVLFDMYSYSCKAVREIRDEVININPPNISGFCQNCGLSRANTMDHYLPRGRFPEYAIHAKNLIPCCSECNENKGEGEILNAYLDVLPDEEFLFMDVKRDGDTLAFTFRLENNSNKIDSVLFSRIEQHYTQLKLFDRMREASIPALTRFGIDIKSEYLKHGKGDVIDSVKETLVDYRKKFGYNYWEVAFRKGLIESDVFWSFYQEQLDNQLL